MKFSFSLSVMHTLHKAKALRPLIRAACTATLRQEGGQGDISLAVLFTDDAALRALNRDFRGRDKPTNVLSFPSGEYPPSHELRTANHVFLGDIAVSLETVAREAEAQGKSFEHHLTHLIVHSVLHLLGHDHEDEAEAEAMEAKETAILTGLGVADPYILCHPER